MHAILGRLAADRRTGLVFIDHSGHRRDYTFAEVADQSQRFAAVLRAFGVCEGARVAMCDANTSKCLFLLLALERLGALPVICGEDLSDQELLARIGEFSADTVATNRRRLPRVAWVQEFLPPATRYILVGGEREGWARIDTLAKTAKPYTGGGAPADTFLPEICAVAQNILQAQPGDRVWNTFSFGTDRWLAFVQAPLCSGVASILHEGPFKARERIDLLHELSPTILAAPASEYHALLHSVPSAALRLPRLRRCVALDASPELCEQWEAATGIALTAATFEH